MKYSKMNIKMFFDILVNDEMRTEFKMLHHLKATLSTLKRGTLEYDYMAQRVRTVRQACKAKAHSQYRVVFNQGKRSLYTEKGEPLVKEQWYASLPEPLAFREVAEETISDIRRFRAEDRAVRDERKNMMGYDYRTTGGVFLPMTNREGVVDLKLHPVLEVAKRSDPMRRITTPKKPDARVKAKYIGIELELMTKMNHDALASAFIKSSLAGYVYIQRDGSIRVEADDEHAHEVTVLCRQEDVESIVSRVCKVLNSPECRAKVNNSCGLHIHVDMRNRNPYDCFNNLVKSLPVLSRMVPTLRVKGAEATRYCRQNKETDLKRYYPDAGNLRNYVQDPGPERRDENRYQAINPASLGKFNTIEVRLHSGTTNAKKISMWANICAAIADAPLLKEQVTNVDEFAANVMKNDKVLDYMDQRIKLFDAKKDAIDTRGEWTLDMMEVG